MDWQSRSGLIRRSHQFWLFPISHVRSLLLDRAVIRLRAEHHKHRKFRNVRVLRLRLPRDADRLRDGFLRLQGPNLHNLPVQHSHVRHIHLRERPNG